MGEMFRAIPGWMCLVDFDYELGEALGGTTIYPSEDNLRNIRECIENCGIAEVVTLSKSDFNKIVLKANLTQKDFYDSNIGALIWEKDNAS